jgi:hypothetical protein
MGIHVPCISRILSRLVTGFQLGERGRFHKVRTHVNRNSNNDVTDEKRDTPKPGLGDVLDPQQKDK